MDRHPPHALQQGLAECSDLGSALHLWKPALQDEPKLQHLVNWVSAQWHNEQILEKAGQISSDQTQANSKIFVVSNQLNREC